MADAAIQIVPELVTDDRAALRMMLEYVERECRRIGAMAAAQHAAQAAACIADATSPPEPMALSPLH